ncbi:hypothetical protein [Actinocrispum wychmicini]|uniref:hypothetical protein n=1 Tax=Actinocrispum wychmicini TaxID=1213861 RepID=UPI001053F727|nr:hypothetical protein [Actinocrispum wychmicini]
MPIRRQFVLTGVVTAAMLCLGGPAFAGQDNDLLGGGSGDAPLVSNVSVLPMQMCGSGVFVSGLTAAPDGMQTGNCTNAPTGDPLQELITNSVLH